ncbi:MAG TPA: hypothetical protein VFV75_03750 [Candidatus Polarisedimenticolaceae bacterium]|nr:hypothetical protein [Candidatus Polarisedimenticolaceae bacterium]
MIRIESSSEGRARVIGALEASALRALLEGANGRGITLDLTQVYAAEGAAVRLLAELPPERCTVVACPQWLALWLEGEGRELSQGETQDTEPTHSRPEPRRNQS